MNTKHSSPNHTCPKCDKPDTLMVSDAPYGLNNYPTKSLFYECLIVFCTNCGCTVGVLPNDANSHPTETGHSRP